MFVSVFAASFYKYFYTRNYTYIIDEDGTEAHASDVNLVFDTE